MQQREKTEQEMRSEAGRALVALRWAKATPEDRAKQAEVARRVSRARTRQRQQKPA